MKHLLLTIVFLSASFSLLAQTRAFEENIQSIMSKEILGVKSIRYNEGEKEHERPDRTNLSQNPLSSLQSQFPVKQSGLYKNTSVLAPQTVSTTFTGATLSGSSYNTSSFPPDNMGAVGPTQFIVTVNGRIATYNKSTGLPDGVLNTDMDTFFGSVMTPPVSSNFTSDPRVRYDRITKRWFFLIIDVPGGSGNLPNRVLIGVSQDSVITASTVIKYFYFQHDLVSPAGNTGSFFDYPTLGIDNNALYIGGNVFASNGSYQGTSAFVVNKASILGDGPITVYAFRNLATTGNGVYTPQGVDNFDPAATEGYFIGVDNASYGTLVLKKISNPGGVPTISSDINITVPVTSAPINVPHLGNTKSTNGYLDGLDDRLFAAFIRNGHIWTAHNIAVNTSGVGSSSGTRDAVRWYDIKNINTATPSLNQSGTIFDNASANPRFYWIPTIMVNGQGHAALGFSNAGVNAYINAGIAGRLSIDALGTTQSVFNYTSSTTAYNPASDPGGSAGRRWGDYSYVSVDPQDDMTMWTIQQFCSATNIYGCRVAKLLAPPPPAIDSCSPAVIGTGSSIDVVVTGNAATGAGFFDPGATFSKHLTASVDGGVTVNSVKYTNPSTLVLNLSTDGAVSGLKTITITNPDGQQITSSTTLNYDPSMPVELISFTARVLRKNEVKLEWATASELNALNFVIERSADESNWSKVALVKAAGNSTTYKNYSVVDNTLMEKGLYSYRIKQYDVSGDFEILKSIEVNYNYLPGEFSLRQNYPNPFNPETKISYDVAERSNVKITVFDILGNEIAQLVNETKEPGTYEVQFNGSALSSGVYIYRMQTDNFISTQKMTLLK